jgi:cardiolipin synthase
MSWWTIATIAEIVWVGLVGLGILLERRSPVATIAWVLTLAWLPLFGIAVYYFFGPRRLGRRRLKRAAGAKLLAHAIESIEDESDHPQSRAQLARLGVAAGEAPPLRAERVDVYVDGKACYEAIRDAIDRATHHVHLEYYIYDGDHTGTRLRDQLIRRAKEGIEVRLLVDSLGSYSLTNAFLRPLAAAGVQYAEFNAVSLLRVRPRMTNFRTHRKIIVVDGTVGFTGGMNIADCHTPEFHGAAAWRDTHVRFEGAAVRALQRVFLEDWYFATETPPPQGPAYLVPLSRVGDHFVQVVASGPDQDVFAIHKLYFGAITTARERVWLQTPYFVPDEPLTSALVSAALRGIDVRLLVPAKGDSRLVDFAARSYFPELLRAGVKIYEYLPRVLHAKTAVIDDDLSIIGTANLDNRSFRLNFEVVAAIYGPETAKTLVDAYEKDLLEARPVSNRELRKEPMLTRLGESTARLLSPML